LALRYDILEGFIEVKGKHPILVIALHGFGSDRFKDVIARIKEYGLYDKFKDIVTSNSAVDFLTGEIAFKVGIAEKCRVILPTISKVDMVNNLPIPDYNLNKEYALITPIWRRVEELIKNGLVNVIVDIHGMKAITKWPDICISCANYTTASKETIDSVARVFKKLGYSVKIDKPFKGGAFIRHFGNPPATEAFSIEIKRNHRFLGSNITWALRLIIREIIKLKKL